MRLKISWQHGSTMMESVVTTDLDFNAWVDNTVARSGFYASETKFISWHSVVSVEVAE